MVVILATLHRKRKHVIQVLVIETAPLRNGPSGDFALWRAKYAMMSCRSLASSSVYGKY
jgi:hypothetical protein